jgi:hypothetical protein
MLINFFYRKNLIEKNLFLLLNVQKNYQIIPACVDMFNVCN